MLQVARLAPKLLGDAADPVEAFLREEFGDDGGARDRAGASDLYYTVFALDGLVALRSVPPPAAADYVRSFGAGDDLDIVHLACLARCRAALELGDDASAGIAANLERFRSAGGWAAEAGAEPTIYHTFLGLGALQDLGLDAPDASALADCVAARRAADGGYGARPGDRAGSTPVTAAAATLLRYLGRPAPDGVAEWLLARCHGDGGFRAAPEAPMPDLLSTATALHALAGLHADLAPIRERCLDFVDSLWTGEAFCGHWADDVKDSEYTFYALLALGHLSL